MRKVRQRDTAPELAVRRFLHRAGLRFRLHVAGMPGTPDIVLPKYRTVVFVHGCFWHGHTCAHGAVRAKTNGAYWDAKIAANRARDQRKARALKALGWKVECVWECRSANARTLQSLAVRIRSRC